MSGTVRVRRQWQIQDGPRGTLRRLRSQLAEDGCVESQVVMAKHLLEECQDGGDCRWTENSTQAVYWLTKASEQGNVEAAKLLNNCFKSGTGITEENYRQVKTCLNMSMEERAFRSAARELFASLTPFGQQYVTTHQLKARISSQSGERSNASRVSDNDMQDSSDIADGPFNKWYRDTCLLEGEHVSEDKLVKIAGQVSRGELPTVNLIDEPPSKCLPRQQLFLHRVMDLLLRGLTSVSSKTLDVVANHGDSFLSTLLPLNQVRTVVLVFALSFIPLDSILYVSPLVGFYVSLAVMAVSNLQMICNVRRYSRFAAWLGLFRTAEPSLDADRAQKSFCRQRLRPYCYYFAALVTMLCCRPFCTSDAICFSDLTMLSLWFALLSVVALNVSLTRHVWAFVAATALAAAVRFVDRESMASLSSSVLGVEIVRKEFGDRIVVNFGLNVVPVLLLGMVLLWMAFSSSEHGFYCVVLPNLVCLTWVHLFGIFYPAATSLGLVRSVAAFTAVVALPVTVLVVIPVAVAARLLGLVFVLWESTYLAPTLFAVLVISVASVGKWVADRRSDMGAGRWKKWLLGIQVACGVLAVLQFVPALRGLSFGEATLESGASPLDWKSYHDLCYRPSALERLSLAKIQDHCSHLSGVNVHWKGFVKEVRISKILNWIEDTLGHLPDSVAAHLRCIYGSSYEDGDEANEGMDSHLVSTFSLVRSVTRRKCHLGNWNVYEFSVDLHMGSDSYWDTAELVLKADDSFKDFVFRLLPNDEIDFTGYLTAGVGNAKPIVNAFAVRCVDCVHHLEPLYKVRVIDVREKWETLFGFIFNFMFFPYIELKDFAESV